MTIKELTKADRNVSKNYMNTIKRSIFWASVEQLGPQFITFVISIILARLLNPTDYGLIGMLTLFLAFAQLFSDAGMSQALIQRKYNSDDDLKSVFVLNIATGILLSIILSAISPLVAIFFKEPKLIEIMCVVSINFTISSFGNVQFTLMSRDLDLKKTAIISFISTITSGIVSLTMAILGLGVWSLVGGGLTMNIARVISLWSLSAWKPIGKFSWNSVRSIWKYSANLLGAGLFTTFADNLSNVLIGRSYSAAALGRPIVQKLIFHSDRGIQFACTKFTNILDANKFVVRSMSRKGNCWDNAVAESFFKTIKVESVYNQTYHDQNQAKLSIFTWIETWYNRRRRHSALGYKTIEEFEILTNNKQIAA